MALTEKEKSLQTVEGFRLLVFEFYPDYVNWEQAYEAAERHYFQIYGKNRFKTFESYKSTICINAKKNIKHKKGVR